MEILRILNNNVVVALNDDQKEVVLMGNGLGFQKKPGFQVDKSRIEKVFEIKNQVESIRIEQMLSEIPEDVIAIAFDILNYAKKKLNKEFNETSFISFADHLHTAIQRAKKGIQMKNFLLWDIKRFFPEELAIARKGIQFVNEKMGIELSDDESGFLTLHIVNAEIDSTNEAAINLTQMIEEILTVIKYTLKINFAENDIYFQRFITHLRFFSERVLNARLDEIEEDAVENELFVLINKKYPEAFEATKKVVELLDTRWHYQASKDEQVYITIHIARIIEKTK
ncbi:beta-glucoside operon transcriptional antiterminator [Enterococcus sp. DIV2402]|uniref:Beta-glucoside operon transcriptional antiterminator n=1 Tax=Candidatus Enterococcus lowellii TaxID=2230877 RepID=A0ABZ2SIL2_9ENTE|nr:PRD domain-containing protein [Enterococcus sp. DIV2402]MBO0464783.1 PRD domain-containing protein [Enterococcus sp. DIV2402]